MHAMQTTRIQQAGRAVAVVAVAAVAVATLASGLSARSAPARARPAQPDSLARVEAAYARAIAGVADSAIRQLDVLPARTQLRVQSAFLDPSRARAIPFGALATLSDGAAVVVADLGDQFGALTPPPDLAGLHGALTAALRDARSALSRLAAASTACQGSAISLQRCQVPFTDASSRMTRAYRQYLDVRRKVRDQITDTGTILPELPAPRQK